MCGILYRRGGTVNAVSGDDGDSGDVRRRPVAAHTVTFGWTDNGNGTVTLWNEHWHFDQTFPCNEGVLCSANGGLTISGNGSLGS